MAGPGGVRKGTRVWLASAPPVVPPPAGGLGPAPLAPNDSLPEVGEGWGGGGLFPGRSTPHEGDESNILLPIENIHPGDWVLAHDGQPHRVLRAIHQRYQGLMIGIQLAQIPVVLWLTPDLRVLAKMHPRSLGGHSDWSGVPLPHRGRARELRREMTPPERKLWQALRVRALGVKFRRQHPIGPYIADFYSREAQLVVEVDGACAHSGEDAVAYDRARDGFLQSLGLRVLRIPAVDVERNLEGVLAAVQEACSAATSPEDAEWVEASRICEGDRVFVGPQRAGVRVERLWRRVCEEEVYGLEVEGSYSLLTEVCVVRGGFPFP